MSNGNISAWSILPIPEKLQWVKVAHNNVRPTGENIAKYISDILGCEVSRSAVIGFFDREKDSLKGYPLEGRMYDPGKTKPLIRTPRARKSPPKPAAHHNFKHKAISALFKAPDEEHKLTYQLEARDCRYIVQGEGAAARYCCAATPVDSSWCTYHRMVVSGRGTESERNAIKALERSAR